MIDSTSRQPHVGDYCRTEGPRRQCACLSRPPTRLRGDDDEVTTGRVEQGFTLATPSCVGLVGLVSDSSCPGGDVMAYEKDATLGQTQELSTMSQVLDIPKETQC